MLERATRLCNTSPQIATVRPPSRVLAAADRQSVEQGLGRVLVTAVAGIDDGAIDLLRQELHCARFGMAHDQHIGMHRVQRHRGIDQGLALAHRAGLHRHVDGQSAPSRLPATSNEVRVRSNSRRNVDQRAAAQLGILFFRLTVQLDIAVGKIEARHG